MKNSYNLMHSAMIACIAVLAIFSFHCLATPLAYAAGGEDPETMPEFNILSEGIVHEMQFERNADGTIDVKLYKDAGSGPALETTVRPANQGAGTSMATCGNGVCEPEETADTCIDDCGVCGDGICSASEDCDCEDCSDEWDCTCVAGGDCTDPGENCSTCPEECGICCGDGNCDAGIGEDVDTCYDDCHCGDLFCDFAMGETYLTCDRDCTRSGHSCHLAGTMITMADGSQKPIEAIEVGDVVLSFDKKTKTTHPDAVTDIFHHPAEGLHYIINGNWRVTPVHPALTNNRWVSIGYLKVGDTLTNAKGEDVVIESMSIVLESAPVYNFEVNPSHNYIADGYVVHNGKLEIEGSKKCGPDDPECED